MPLKQATICLLLKNDEVLLAMKKRGFGKGLWNGVGGKPNEGESMVDAARRESEEEIGVKLAELTEVAVLDFHLPHRPQWSQRVFVYTCTEWEGEPTESEEMNPKWFKISEVPYGQMWWDDKHWMPIIFQGKKVKASFVFDENNKVTSMDIKEIKK